MDAPNDANTESPLTDALEYRNSLRKNLSSQEEEEDLGGHHGRGGHGASQVLGRSGSPIHGHAGASPPLGRGSPALGRAGGSLPVGRGSPCGVTGLKRGGGSPPIIGRGCPGLGKGSRLECAGGSPPVGLGCEGARLGRGGVGATVMRPCGSFGFGISSPSLRHGQDAMQTVMT